jgi:hypothetical protein
MKIETSVNYEVPRREKLEERYRQSVFALADAEPGGVRIFAGSAGGGDGGVGDDGRRLFAVGGGGAMR